jgi:hypothetical protein
MTSGLPSHLLTGQPAASAHSCSNGQTQAKIKRTPLPLKGYATSMLQGAAAAGRAGGRAAPAGVGRRAPPGVQRQAPRSGRAAGGPAADAAAAAGDSQPGVRITRAVVYVSIRGTSSALAHRCSDCRVVFGSCSARPLLGQVDSELHHLCDENGIWGQHRWKWRNCGATQ